MHFGYWTLISDPKPKKYFQKLKVVYWVPSLQWHQICLAIGDAPGLVLPTFWSALHFTRLEQHYWMCELQNSYLWNSLTLLQFLPQFVSICTSRLPPPSPDITTPAEVIIASHPYHIKALLSIVFAVDPVSVIAIWTASEHNRYHLRWENIFQNQRKRFTILTNLVFLWYICIYYKFIFW